MDIAQLLAGSPIIAAVKDENSLEKSLASDCQVIFVLAGTICDIETIVEKVKAKNRIAIVHADLVTGLSSKEVAVDFIKNNTKADGVISTKSIIVKRARELGMISIQRTFVVDSIALGNLKRQLDSFRPDAVEIMPGIMPKIIKEMKEYTTIPIIAGGLLSEKKDVVDALSAGADAISTTREALWYV